MTEAEWLAFEAPQTMLSFLLNEDLRRHPRYPATDRKLRLFACACCRLLPRDSRVADSVIDQWEEYNGAIRPCSWARDWAQRYQARAAFLRDIFGPLPFRLVTFDPVWRTATTTSLATAIYAEQAWHDLPILADALEDAGCTNADILGHCRGGGEHVRGCWALDVILGKH
jgi:hypothetical protein